METWKIVTGFILLGVHLTGISLFAANAYSLNTLSPPTTVPPDPELSGTKESCDVDYLVLENQNCPWMLSEILFKCIGEDKLVVDMFADNRCLYTDSVTIEYEKYPGTTIEHINNYRINYDQDTIDKSKSDLTGSLMGFMSMWLVTSGLGIWLNVSERGKFWYLFVFPFVSLFLKEESKGADSLDAELS